MLSVFPTERLIDPGIKQEVQDLEPVAKHKKSNKSAFDEFSRNLYSICTTFWTWGSSEAGGFSKALTYSGDTSLSLCTKKCSNWAGAFSSSFWNPRIDKPYLSWSRMALCFSIVSWSTRHCTISSLLCSYGQEKRQTITNILHTEMLSIQKTYELTIKPGKNTF